ncbi:MAG: nuclease-related domain-containing protein [Nanoarchaeota archaeon]
MVRVYGKSDSELSFLSLLNSHMRENIFDSIEQYQEFERNHEQSKKILEIELDKEIKDKIEQINENRNYIQQLKYKLNGYEIQIKKKLSAIGKCYGPLKQRLTSEFEGLKNSKNAVSDGIKSAEDDEITLKTEKDTLISGKKSRLYNFDRDVSKLHQLNKDKDFKNKRQGAIGENKVIWLIEKSFEKFSNYNLINKMNFDISGKGINIHNSSKTETQIDHILVCPKGVFFIETKYWTCEVNDIFKQKLLDQLDKIKMTIGDEFKDKIKEDFIEILLIGTEKRIDIQREDFISLRLDELKSYIDSKKNILSNSEIILILKEFIPYLNDNHSTFPKRMIKIKSFFINSKKKFQKIIEKSKSK